MHFFPYWDAHLYGYRIVSPQTDARRVPASEEIQRERWTRRVGLAADVTAVALQP
jgi:hypothetical protein